MTEPVDRLVEVERRDGFAIVTLARPDKMNAVSLAMATQLTAALERLSDVAAIVVTGRGRAFCSGVDLTERRQVRQSWRAHLGVDHGQYWADTVAAFYHHPAILIAAVNGYALGGGLTLVNCCDLAVAADTAEFGMPELGFGAVPALAGPTTSQRLLPKHLAEMVFLPGRIKAGQALDWGLVNAVVPGDEVVERACLWAGQIAGRDPVALAYTKRLLQQTPHLDWTGAIEQGALAATTVASTRQVLAASTEPSPTAPDAGPR